VANILSRMDYEDSIVCQPIQVHQLDFYLLQNIKLSSQNDLSIQKIITEIKDNPASYTHFE